MADDTKMNIFFIGGSNFVLTRGISEKLPRLLSNAGLMIGSVSNISVGGTGSLFGLENLITYLGPNPDLVFIEYGINDLPNYTGDRVLWMQGFSNLLLLTRERYPSALVFMILLGRRDEIFWTRQTQMHADMVRLASEHGVNVINFDELFKSEPFQGISFKSLYLDGSHYQEPLITGYIAQQCAIHCLGMIKSRDAWLNAAATPSISLSKKFDLRLTPVPGASRRFKNSRFLRDTAVLEKNSSLVIEVPGMPVGLSFVSAKESCSIRIDFSNQSKIIHTLHREVYSKKFNFLSKHVPLFGVWRPNVKLPESTRVKLHALDTESERWSESLVQKTYNMIESGPLGSGLYLCNISSVVSRSIS